MKVLKIVLWSLACAALLCAVILWGYVLLNRDKGMKDEGLVLVEGGTGYERETAAGSLAAAASADTQVAGYSPSFAVDGDIETYWEGNGAYPESFTVTLSKEAAIGRIVIRLNPIEIWGKRTMRFSVAASGDGETFREILPEAEYVFDWAEGNGTELDLTSEGIRAGFIRLIFTANSGAGGGQIAEIEIYEAE
ncbi:MAG: discoidin domain-containing protein [Clostridia bacterium]|nr:discoidin domain-containing protein [Clostridia bacterium]